MKIYKFKDLSDEGKHFHFYQIVLKNTIWCAKPDSLNDKDEFKTAYKTSPRTYDLLDQVITKYGTTNYLSPLEQNKLEKLEQNKLEEIASRTIKDLINSCRNTIGICSFSMTNTYNNLWNEYGGKGNGVCIEINIPESLIKKSYWPVNYVTEKIFPIDSLLESALFEDKVYNTYRNILLTKTKRWEQEKEIRFIAKCQEESLPIDGYISEITFGHHVQPDTFKRIEAKINNHCIANNIKITKL